jgi:hypothetical protein
MKYLKKYNEALSEHEAHKLEVKKAIELRNIVDECKDILIEITDDGAVEMDLTKAILSRDQGNLIYITFNDSKYRAVDTKPFSLGKYINSFEHLVSYLDEVKYHLYQITYDIGYGIRTFDISENFHDILTNNLLFLNIIFKK